MVIVLLIRLHFILYFLEWRFETASSWIFQRISSSLRNHFLPHGRRRQFQQFFLQLLDSRNIKMIISGSLDVLLCHIVLLGNKLTELLHHFLVMLFFLGQLLDSIQPLDICLLAWVLHDRFLVLDILPDLCDFPWVKILVELLHHFLYRVFKVQFNTLRQFLFQNFRYVFGLAILVDNFLSVLIFAIISFF